MELTHLGFDAWFRDKQAGLGMPGASAARVVAVDRDRYVVRNESGEVPAEITGKLRFSAESSLDFPAVGDWVIVQYHNEGAQAIVHALFPRKTILTRKSAGKSVDHQLLAANIDTAFIVQSCDADFNLRRLERYLVMIGEGHIEPVILLSKSDLVDDGVAERMIAEIPAAGIDARTIAFSNETGHGLDRVREELVGARTYCLLGSSGVGKTTLLNRLAGQDAFVTSEVREADGKGRHTTTRRQLVVLDRGAMLIDTPGMRELANIGADGGIDESFADIGRLAVDCRFKDCTHTGEAGCAVLAALDKGALDARRYDSYLKLVKESDYHRMSHLEKRRKDRRFGRFVKSVMKQKKKK